MRNETDTTERGVRGAHGNSGKGGIGMMKRTGFTLIEVLIAIAIVGIVASISIGQYGLTVQRARWDAAQNILLAVYAGEQTYYTLNSSQYRTNLDETKTMAEWREVFVDNPNRKNPATNAYDVTYKVSGSGSPLSTDFKAQATNVTTTKIMLLNQDRDPTGSDWARP